MDIPSIREYSDIVEQYSIDEAFVDMTASCHMFGTPEETAEQIKDRIKDELGFTVNIGKYASIGIIRIHQNYHYRTRTTKRLQKEGRKAIKKPGSQKGHIHHERKRMEPTQVISILPFILLSITITTESRITSRV